MNMNIKEVILQGEKEFIEKGADLEHQRWARWQKYMFRNCQQNEDGSLTIPIGLVKRWFRQIDTKYKNLTEQEKESDRKETRNYLPLIASQNKKLLEAVMDKLDEMKRRKDTRHPSELYDGELYDAQDDGYNSALSDFKQMLEDTIKEL